MLLTGTKSGMIVAGGDAEIAAWFALQTRSRHEKRVTGSLAECGVETYLPHREVRRRWHDRTTIVKLPLFAGYTFARFRRYETCDVSAVRGVVGVVGNQYGPLPVPDDQIEAVRRLVLGRMTYDPYPYLIKGKPVRVVAGPLQGVEGQLVRKGRSHRFIVAVPLLGQSVSVEIDARLLEPV